MINAPLWTELFLLNKEMLLPHIDRFKLRLDEIRNAIEADDTVRLNEILEDTREKRIRMGGVR